MFTCLWIFIVPSILGVSSDFLQAEEAAQVELVRLEEAAKAPENKRKTQDIMKEAETSPESTEEQQRPSRQSFSFSSFGPFSDSSRSQQDEGLSFQRVRMGPGDTDRSVGFKGFNFDKVFSPSNTGTSRSQQQESNSRHFSNFPDVSTSVSQGSFSPTLRPSSRTLNFARNRDPRRRNRQRTSTQSSFSLQPTALPLRVTEEPRRSNFVELRKGLDTDFQKFNVRGSRPDTERPPSLSRSRQSFRSSPSLGGPEPVRQRLNNRFSSEIQNSLDETVRTLEAARQRNDDLIQNCIKEAEKHASEIAELENRTALHIEYAQEKQIEIQNLEIIIDTFKNKSQDFLSIKNDYSRNLTMLESEIISKDSLINKLKDDIAMLEKSFSKEEMKKHQEIETLNERIENASIELANDKIRINQLENENQDKINGFQNLLRAKDEEIKEGLKRLEKYKHEKLNLLKIVQQLADLGNPALTFTATIDDLDYYDQLQEEQEQLQEQIQEQSAGCCDDTQEFVNYDVNEIVERVDYDEYEGSASNENFSDPQETSQEEYTDLL